MPRRTHASAKGPRPARDASTPPRRPAFAQAMLAAALADLGDGRQAAALARLRMVDPADAGAADARAIGGLLLDLAAVDLALSWFDRALENEPRGSAALAGRARALAALGRAAEALAACTLAVRAGAADPALHLAHGHLLRSAGEREAAITAYDAALRLRPAFPEALRAGGTLLREAGHGEAALRFLGEAARLAPGDPDTALDLADLLQAAGRFDDAVLAYDAVLAHRPDHAMLLTNRGVALQELGRLPEARASYAAAVAADPMLAPARLNLGNALVWFGEAEAAQAAFEAALALRPDYPEALCGRGVALKLLGRFDAAAQDFDAALTLRPGFAQARANRGELRLLRGDWAGWADYEDRFRAGRQPMPVLNRPVPAWDGSARQGAHLVVLADQGNGDMIHFARYLPMLAGRGLAVTLLCPARLHRVLAPVTGGIRVTDLVAAEEPADWQIPLSSLPFALATEPATIPLAQGYLQPEPEQVRRWADRIGGTGLRIGLCWRGSQHWQADPRRSLPLAALEPLAMLPGVRLLSLQMPDSTGHEDEALARLGIDPLGAELDHGPDSFLDTAAAMASLDLVVTCDTSIAHLAGALGRPAAVLLQAVPEWRWLLDREDSPWYGSLRLFRQTRPGSWVEPVAALATAVRARTAAPAP